MAGIVVDLDDVVHFDVTTYNPSTGASANADSPPTFKVYEEDNDTEIVSGVTVLRSGLTGQYRGSFTVNTSNGFESGKFYNIAANASVSGINASVIAIMFKVESWVTKLLSIFGGISGLAVADVGNTVSSFITNLAETTDNFYGDSNGGATLVFVSGDNIGLARRISEYNGSTKVITVESPFPNIPQGDDSFIIIGRIEV